MVQRIAAQQAVPAKLPQIAGLTDCWTGRYLGDLVFLARLVSGIDDQLDFAQVKAGQGLVDFQLAKLAKFERKQATVPPCLLGEPVIGNHVGTLLLLRSASRCTGQGPWQTKRRAAASRPCPAITWSCHRPAPDL